ncbi:TIGR02186 family protein [Palleronia caenipelagi]|uniref:TIGR02186 family protein n=1 Tax=Palleronia caenipelagi TaxID=2489174 RepID=A0A547Q5B6_9RHOB|nr:TIGR02186 family protein [Palleronia caenipelagi]TRD21537.1 hypothetical protein FEV53_08625 [Palleronia caenipelagi]
MRWFVALLWLLAAPVYATEELVAGLSTNRISISATFAGSELMIFGAVKRDAPIADGNLGVIITVEGPKAPITLRQKERLGPIWVNRSALEIDKAPSFYAVNTSQPLTEILSATDNLRHGITIRRAIRSVGAPATIKDPAAFSEALIRLKEKDGLYKVNENTVLLRQSTLFDTSVALPANLIEGPYVSRIFLTRDGKVIESERISINVTKVGLERFLYRLSQENPLTYGILSLVLAIFAGWGASAIFRQLKS